MLKLMIRKEILSHVLSLRFGVTFILFLILIFAGIYVTVNDYLVEVSRYGTRVRCYQDQLAAILAEKQDWGPHGRLELLFDTTGKTDAIPVAPLAWLGQGVQAVVPEGVRAQPGEFKNIDKGLSRNPLLGLLPTPDFVYIVNVVLSLLAILFMFDAVCGEKETGTLRLTLSNSIPRYQVLLGKWIGGYAVLIVPFLIATAGGLGYAWAKGALVPDAKTLTHVAILMGLAGLYIALFFNLSLFVSTTTHNSATALLVCLLVWVVFILAIPNLAPVTARILEPTPSPQMILAEKRAVIEEIGLKIRRLNLTSGEYMMGDKIQRAREKLEMEQKRRHRQWDAMYDNAAARQFDLAQSFGRLSPSACWVFAALGLSQTGPDSYHRLAEAARRWALVFKEYEEKYYKDNDKPGNQRMADIRPDALPNLTVSRPALAQIVRDAAPDFMILATLNVVFFMLAFAFFVRYDVR